MIELGEIQLRDPLSIVETRNKMLGLARALRLDSVNATRLATAMSASIRSLIETGASPSLSYPQTSPQYCPEESGSRPRYA